MYEKNRFDWSSLILGVLFLIISLMAFKNPGSSLVAIVIYFAITAIINGITSIFIRNQVKQVTGFKATALLILGILEVVLGIVLMFNLHVGIMALAYVFAMWFVIDSVRNLFMLSEARLISTAYYWFSMIVNIIGIFIGFSLFFDPIVSMLTLSFLVGFYLMLMGIFYVVRAFTK